MILYMCTSCLSLGYYVCRPARAGRRHDMTVHPSPRCKCGCPEQIKTTQSTNVVLKLNVHFSAKWIVLCLPRLKQYYSIGFQYVITAALQCQTFQGGFQTKNASASKRYCCTSHLRPLFGKTPNDGRTLASMPNNITCHFKSLI